MKKTVNLILITLYIIDTIEEPDEGMGMAGAKWYIAIIWSIFFGICIYSASTLKANDKYREGKSKSSDSTFSYLGTRDITSHLAFLSGSNAWLKW